MKFPILAFLPLTLSLHSLTPPSLNSSPAPPPLADATLTMKPTKGQALGCDYNLFNGKRKRAVTPGDGFYSPCVGKGKQITWDLEPTLGRTVSDLCVYIAD